MKAYVAGENILKKILERKKRGEEFRAGDVDLSAMLQEILSAANLLVPSESGSIILDDPTLDRKKHKNGFLYFIACFGKGSVALTGTKLHKSVGIAGRTYTIGKPCISRRVCKDANFYAGIDRKIHYKTQSLICAPIIIEGTTIGVIELINRKKSAGYAKKDLTLLKIFAGYTSTLIQNSLDAKKFGKMSVIDNLTGLYNDRYFYSRLTDDVTHALADGTDLSVIFFDLDHFKEVNDLHGHLAGSRVLTEVGRLLKKQLGYAGNTCVRYGGDEFVVIVPGASADGAMLMAESLRKIIEKNIFLKTPIPGIKKPLRLKGLITASLGVASIKEHIDSSAGALKVCNALIKKSDAAMYASKKKGKNTVSLSD